MMKKNPIHNTNEQIGNLIKELIEGQRQKLLRAAQRLVPYVTADDILQPNDFPELEHHPHFRYEEGILEGLMTVQAALNALPTADIKSTR